MPDPQEEKRPARAPAAGRSQEAFEALLCDALPRQGCWTDEEYLWLTDRTRRLIEFTDGRLEELPMPTSTHQAILSFLNDLFKAHVVPMGGVVLFSALRLRIREGKFRAPDLLLLGDRRDRRYRDRFWLGADLVLEVVSPDRPDRDLVEKRADYAEAGIPEYWIVDPRTRTVTVLALQAGSYVEHGVFSPRQVATSKTLPAFRTDVTDVFEAPEPGQVAPAASAAVPSHSS